jgi:hypothetical protein
MNEVMLDVYAIGARVLN